MHSDGRALTVANRPLADVAASHLFVVEKTCEQPMRLNTRSLAQNKLS
jgi:hypothetical protein